MILTSMRKNQKMFINLDLFFLISSFNSLRTIFEDVLRFLFVKKCWRNLTFLIYKIEDLTALSLKRNLSAITSTFTFSYSFSCKFNYYS